MLVFITISITSIATTKQRAQKLKQQQLHQSTTKIKFGAIEQHHVYARSVITLLSLSPFSFILRNAFEASVSFVNDTNNTSGHYGTNQHLARRCRRPRYLYRCRQRTKRDDAMKSDEKHKTYT